MARKDKTDKIFDYIESELPLYCPEDRKQLARDIIKWAAIQGTDDNDDNPFAPLNVLNGIKEELTEEIDKIMLDTIGEECVKLAQKE